MGYKTEDFARQIQAVRQAAGLSQRELSAKTGVTQSQVSQFESGTHEPRLSKLIDLARALDLELVLVPRKTLPAIQSIVRASEPQRESPTYALREIERAERLVTKQRALHGPNAALDRLGDALRFFRHAPIRAAEIAAISAGADRLRRYPASPENAEVLDDIAADWTAMRNRLARGRSEAPRPAYAMAEDDDA